MCPARFGPGQRVCGAKATMGSDYVMPAEATDSEYMVQTLATLAKVWTIEDWGIFLLQSGITTADLQTLEGSMSGGTPEQKAMKILQKVPAYLSFVASQERTETFMKYIKKRLGIHLGVFATNTELVAVISRVIGLKMGQAGAAQVAE
eukprot:TRINITY_DN19395_c0_g1_i1.p1 TRINITY_DN19395_c0_g1~~TRINITY_DN19395_c0_g1_i1.p1  ORF type:complete len:148 (+),score=20.55 TRINITY_DN19395_c0_g1_i1:273-716(+)